MATKEEKYLSLKWSAKMMIEKGIYKKKKKIQVYQLYFDKIMLRDTIVSVKSKFQQRPRTEIQLPLSLQKIFPSNWIGNEHRYILGLFSKSDENIFALFADLGFQKNQLVSIYNKAKIKMIRNTKDCRNKKYTTNQLFLTKNEFYYKEITQSIHYGFHSQ